MPRCAEILHEDSYIFTLQYRTGFWRFCSDADCGHIATDAAVSAKVARPVFVLLGLFGPLTLAETNPGAASILVDELHAGIF